jgi:outer membrane protein assembly factor BamB
VGDKLYVFARQGDDEVVLCLDATNGKEVWNQKYAAQAVTGAASRHPGPRSSPAVVDGKVIVLGVGGILSCLDAASGKVLWQKDPFPKVVPKFFTSYSPIVVDGMVIAYLGGAGNGAIIAFDLTSNQEKWRWAQEGPDYGSPVLLTVAGIQQVVTPTEKSIVGIAITDGKLLWQLPFAPVSRSYNAATPIVVGSTVIYTGAGRGTHAVKIEKTADGFAPQELWSNPDLAVQFNTPVLKDGLLFGLSDRNNLFCLDAQTGQTTWKDTATHGSRGFGAMVDAGNCLLVLDNDSDLVILQPDGKSCNEIKRYKVSETPTYSTPVLADKRIFIKDENTVTLWTVE